MLKTISLLAILPALTFAFFIPFPVYGPDTLTNSSKVEDDKMSHYSHVDNLEKATNFETHNSKICSFVDYVDTVLCNSTESVSGSGLDSMSFNQNRNENQTKESKNNFQNIKNKNSSIEFNLELDPKDLCPLLELVDKSFCKSGKGVHAATSGEKENIDPKDLCPLLELIETKLCS